MQRESHAPAKNRLKLTLPEVPKETSEPNLNENG